MIIRNSYLWFHILGGVYLCKFFLKIGLAPQLALLCVLGVAIAWEVLEYYKDDVEKVYGSKKRFYKDALQDIGGALIAAIGVVL